MDQSTTELIERLSRLERQQAGLQRSNRHLRMITGALVLICGALFTMAQTSSAVPDTVEAQQFLVRDSGGKLRAAFLVARVLLPAILFDAACGADKSVRATLAT